MNQLRCLDCHLPDACCQTLREMERRACCPWCDHDTIGAHLIPLPEQGGN